MKLLISNDSNQIDDHQLMLWSKRSVGNKTLSIINFIEENEKEIKKSFCDIIDNLNIYKVEQKNFIDYLNIQNSYSSFWCSDFYEKSFYKNPEIINQLKLIALKKFLIDTKPNKVVINVSSKVDTQSIEFLCESLSINHVKIKKFMYFNFKLNYFFKPFLALAKFIKFIFFRISFKKINWHKISNLKNKKVFFSYSIYTNKNFLKKGLMNSSYWDPLIKSKLLSNILWVNIYFHTKNNSLKNELSYYEKVNNLSNDYVIFLEQLFDIKIFLRVLYYYFKIVFNVFFLQKSLKKYLQYKNSNFLSHYYIEYFNNSFLSISCLVSIYYYLLLIKLKNKISCKSKIFYLFENQGWEKALNFVLSKDFKTIAINHASIRNWDMRFVNDSNLNKRCIPYRYASNGQDSYNKLIQNNFESKKIIQLEALRYFDLIEKITDVKQDNLYSILVVSDVHDEGNASLEKVLKKISIKKFKSYKFFLKEHVLKRTNFLVNFSLIKTDKKIYELQSLANIAIVSGTTSAAIDLLLMGYELIIPLNINSLNFSPLKNHKNVTFVGDYNKINEILSKKIEQTKANRNFKFENNFFKYNSKLENWKKILNETS